MEFIVKDKEGNELGPVNQDTLIKWTAEGRVRPDTQLRNTLLNVWKLADEFPFLQDALQNQPPPPDEKKHSGLHFKKDRKIQPEEEKKTAFEYKHIPNPANAELRVAAFLVDLVPLLFIGALCFIFAYSDFQKNICALTEEQREVLKNTELAAVQPEGLDEEMKKLPPKDNLEAELPPSPLENLTGGYKAGSKWFDTVSRKKYSCFDADEKSAKWIETGKSDSIFYFYLTIFLFFALLYYGITLGTFAQTLGMWFFGIFIARSDKDLSEVLHFRAFLFSIFMFLFGILTPLLAAMPGKRAALHDILAGARVYRIAGKPKA